MVSEPRRSERGALVACLLSGGAALVYQVLWAREFAQVFGSTARAAAAIMAATMGGMFAGALLYPRLPARWRDRPRTLYAASQIVLAATGLVGPFLGLWARRLSLALPSWGSGPEPVKAFAVAVLLVLVPTAAMGLSLPGLVRAFEKRGGWVARLYGANTAGAMLGALAATFFLLPWLGPGHAFLAAAALNLLAAALALSEGADELGGGVSLLDASPEKAAHGPVDGPAPAPDPAPDPNPEIAPSLGAEAATEGSAAEVSSHRSGEGLLLGAVFVLGALAMAEEALFIRVLQLVIGSTMQAFSLMLAVYLGGLALGASGARVLENRRVDPRRSFAVALFLTCLGLVWALWVADELPAFWGGWSAAFYGSFLRRSALSAALAFVLMAPAALGHGMALPAATACLRRLPAAPALARVSAWQTLGNVTGVLLGGFGLGHFFGLEGGLRGVLALAFLLWIVVAGDLGRDRGRGARRLVLGGALFLGLAIGGLPRWRLSDLHAGFHTYAKEGIDLAYVRRRLSENLLWVEDGPLASVSVFSGKEEGLRFMRIDGKTDAGRGQGDEATQLWAGHLGPLLHEKAERCLVVGLGSGQTAEELLRYPEVTRLTTVEIAPAVVDGALVAFGETLRPALADPRHRLVIDDARHHLAVTEERYDLICSEPTNLWVAGTASLFTVEHFRACHERLRPGGLLCQWLQGYALGGREFAAILRAFHAVFPDAVLFVLDEDFHLVGGRERNGFSYRGMVRRWVRTVRPRLEEHPELALRKIVRGYVCALEDVASHFARGPLQGDGTPIVEAEIPWSTLLRYRDGVVPWPPEAIDRLPMPFHDLAAKDDHGLSSWALGVFLERLPVADGRLWASLDCSLVKHHVPSVRQAGLLPLQPETYGLLKGEEDGLSLALLAAPVAHGDLEFTVGALFPGTIERTGEGSLSGHAARWAVQRVEGKTRFLYWWSCDRRNSGYVLELLAEARRGDWRGVAERFLDRLTCMHGSKVGPFTPVDVGEEARREAAGEEAP